MSPNLCGIHDIEGTAIALPDTWILDTIAISENPPPKSYARSLNWLVRCNWGYGSAGTLPLPSVYEAFAERVAQYVNASSGCHRFIIGNECNLRREWPDGQPIFPWHYAACYKLCRQAIHALPGHARDEVLIAGSGPWNDELKYEGNPTGDWITYFEDTIDLCDGATDGFSIHSYVHRYDPALVTSTARMDAPFQNRYYEFYTYRDYCEAIPESLRHLPCYITEANGNGPWQAVGLMPAMLQEIDAWNKTRQPAISCVVFYRYPRYDQFYIEGRGDVVEEYQHAVMRNYQSPITSPLPPVGPEPAPEPPVPPAPAPGEPERSIDPRLLARGVEFDYATVPAGTGYWRIKNARWLDEVEADAVGPDHHILGDITKDDKLTAGVPFLIRWPSGSTHVASKSDANATYNYNFPMSSSLNEFAIEVADGNPTDKAAGIGMGKLGNPSVHTSTWIDWEWTIAGGILPIPPIPPITEKQRIIWPVLGPVTQYFGSHGISYPGSAGHDGLDFSVVTGTPVLAVADGIVKWVGNDPNGFGLYVRIFHPEHGFHSFMAHLSEQRVQVGDLVRRAQTIALSGSTGNSTGPHLHFSCRIGEEEDYYELHDGYQNGCANPLAVYGLINRVDPNTKLVSRG